MKYNKLSKEDQEKEIEKCQSFEYFYKNYCWKEGMPEYSEEAYQDYLELAKNARNLISIKTRKGKDIHIYSLTPNECFR